MLTYSFYISPFISFSGKNPRLVQFIPRIYNKIILKILEYFWGVIDNWLIEILTKNGNIADISVWGQYIDDIADFLRKLKKKTIFEVGVSL